MQTRQLTLADHDIVMDLIRMRTPTGSAYHNDPSQTSEDRYAFIMQEWYLRGTTHKLFGAFDEGNLVCIGGMRCDLPWQDSWCLTNLKAHPDSDPRKGAMRDTVYALYDEARNMGLPEYYTCMMKGRYRLFQRLAPNRGVSGRDEYDRVIELEIPAGTKPKYDVFWSMMGRRTYSVDVVITRTRLKSYPLSPDRQTFGALALTEPPEGDQKSKQPWPKYRVPKAAINGVLAGM